MYFEKVINGLNMADNAMENARKEIYEQSEAATGLKKVELNYLLRILENADGYDFGKLVNEIRYFTQPSERIEGHLSLNSSERYEIKKADRYFTSGDRIEVFIDNKDTDEDRGWQFGRVEYAHGNIRGLEGYTGYYFLNYSGWDNHALKTGMLAAFRRSVD